MQLASPPPAPSLEPELQGRLDALLAEGWEIWDRFDREVRDLNWHPFVAADYERVLATLTSLRSPGKRFLEWGSATGVIAIMADMLGFESWGIELDADLVQVARDLARRHGSSARFAAGSFLPTGYESGSRAAPGRIRVRLRIPMDG
jgi:predicted cobalt transporter CbtA